MTVLISAVAFFLLITGLVIVHELGHFLVAKKAGVTVEEFGFGLPPKIVRLFKWKGTDFTLNWIPFGGFVRLKGENPSDEKERNAKGSFTSASITWRCLILVAGVAMNFILAFCIFVFGFSAGKWIPTYLTLEDMKAAAGHGEIHLKLGVLIDDVRMTGTAYDAGLAKGVLLESVDGMVVEDPKQVVELQKGKRAVTYVIRDTPTSTETHSLRIPVEDGKTGVDLRTVPVELSANTHTIGEAIALAMRETRLVTSQTILGIAKLFLSLAQRGTVPEGVTGIVGIAQITYASVQEGFMVYLRLVALLSLSLAVLNILPFPALDGGRLIFVLSELFIRPGTRRFEVIANTVGFVAMILLILIVTFYDVFRLFS